MKSIYTQLITEQSQHLCPFGQNEERFRWQNTTLQNHLSTGEDINHFKIKRIRKDDNLDGGIGNFYTKNAKYKNQATKSNRTHRLNSLDNKHTALTLNSQRVIHPSMNQEEDKRKVKQKRMYLSSERLRHSTDGSITSLLQKTPMVIELKGKKRLNRSYDNSSINSLNDVTSTQETKRTGIRLFLNRTPFLLKDEPKTPGRKHFGNRMAQKVPIF